jgi:hypothetical protein
MTVDSVADKAPFLSVVEIFEVGGRTPLHKHDQAHEMFYVLNGRGRAPARRWRWMPRIGWSSLPPQRSWGGVGVLRRRRGHEHQD